MQLRLIFIIMLLNKLNAARDIALIIDEEDTHVIFHALLTIERSSTCFENILRAQKTLDNFAHRIHGTNRIICALCPAIIKYLRNLIMST